MRVIRFATGIALAVLTYPIALAIVLIFVVVRLLARSRRPTSTIRSTDQGITASIVIPTWNGRELLAECLLSVIESVAATPGSHEIIVVDNASTDDSVSFLRSNFPSVLVLGQSTNLGFGGGCNAGVRAARGKYVVLLNNDMKVEKEFLASLLSGFQFPNIFAVTAQIHFWDPSRRREETGKTRGALTGGQLYVMHEQTIRHEPPIQPVFYAGGGSTAYDREKFLELGGFDDIFHPFYVEDTDLSYRAWRRGWPSVLSASSVVYHKHRGTIGQHFDQDYIGNVVRRNSILFVWKNVGDPWILLMHAFVLPTRYLEDALHGRLNLRPLRLALPRLPDVIKCIWRNGPYECLGDRTVCHVANDPHTFLEQFGTPDVFGANQPLNIVFLSPYALYPPIHGGATRMYNVVKRLGRRHKITLLSYVDTEDEAESTRALEEYCHQVIPILRRPDYSHHNPLGPAPLCRVEFDTPDMRRALSAALAHDVDVLQIEYTQMAHFVTPSRRFINVLTEHDVSFLSLYRRFRSRPWSAQKAVEFIAWLKMFNFEISMGRRFDLLLTVTEREEHFLRSYLPDTKISSAAPTGVDVLYFQPRRRQTVCDNSVLFVGYLRHTPNVEAAIYLAKVIFPRVKEACPSARLTLVGANPPAEIRELGRDPSIDVAGYVEDVRECYRTHTVVAAPILSGAGVRVKVLEAMAAGIPVVTTTLGAEGIRCRAGRDLLIANDAESFARSIVTLLNTPDQAEAVARNGRSVVEEYYDWDVIASNLEQLYYKQLAAKRSRGAHLPTTNAIPPLTGLEKGWK